MVHLPTIPPAFFVIEPPESQETWWRAQAGVRVIFVTLDLYGEYSVYSHDGGESVSDIYCGDDALVAWTEAEAERKYWLS